MTREVREALERLRPALGPSTETLWASYLAADMNGRRELESQLLLMDMARNRTGPGQGPPPLPPPEPGVLAGWLRLGDVVYPNTPPTPFGLNRGELIQHVGIFGRSGAGKTNTVMCLLRELLDKDVPFLIFDWKRNYRDLLAAPWVPEGKVRPVTVGRDLAPLRLNPLRPPPGTDPRTWLKKLIEITAHAYFLGEGVMYLLQEAIDACYERAGVYRGSGTYPTFLDVHRTLLARKVTGREANWMASTLRTTASLTYGPMGDTVCTMEPTDVRSPSAGQRDPRAGRPDRLGQGLHRRDDPSLNPPPAPRRRRPRATQARDPRRGGAPRLPALQAGNDGRRTDHATSSSARSGSWARRWCLSTSTRRKWQSPPSATPTARSG